MTHLREWRANLSFMLNYEQSTCSQKRELRSDWGNLSYLDWCWRPRREISRHLAICNKESTSKWKWRNSINSLARCEDDIAPKIQWNMKLNKAVSMRCLCFLSITPFSWGVYGQDVLWIFPLWVITSLNLEEKYCKALSLWKGQIKTPNWFCISS